MTRRPRIGVTVSARTGWRVFPFFCLALWRAGGRAIRIQTGRDRLTLEGLDGLIIGGGDDLSVELYGGRLVPESTFDRARDTLEMALLAEAEERRIPILGVCRGAQLINVVRGGNLHQDIFATYPDARRLYTPLPRKRIRIAPGSRLAAIKGTEPSVVNALHSQSVDRLGEDLRAVAWDEAGIVQAIESARARFVLGVQWHPEYLVFSRRDQRLFAALVEAAREGRDAPWPAGAGEAQEDPLA
ncbi:MAG TPA: gamma-glutamyl-gamma-aminobutyrate hydrolase family protein [Paracoccaceae bacterium]|nr:gamma-glutamyl-gamma-aminobutyrate hydrolase family protein [Paracoccaceae bacterium]